MAIVRTGTFGPAALTPHLLRCGYAPRLLRQDFRFGLGKLVPLAAFADEPADARSACIAVIEANGDPAEAVRSCKELGAPVVFTCHEAHLGWWKQGPQDPAPIDRSVPTGGLRRFFAKHSQELAPDRIYRAKTLGRFDSGHQLSFVDKGLMPLVESEIGGGLTNLIQRVLPRVRKELWPDLSEMTPEQGRWLLQSVFWLLAAKILHDKNVPRFSSLALTDVDEVFCRVSRHYGTTSPVSVPSPRAREALSDAAANIAQYAHLGHVTTESLAYLYESALVSKETRSALGTHSTPSYLVDYMVWQLAEWVEAIPPAKRHVFEPACGHAAFLVSATRLLRKLLPPDQHQARHVYLQERLHGIEIDSFALEIARLSLTLADMPNPNGWDLQHADMFLGDAIERAARRATIFLANPPFQNFSRREKAKYGRQADAPKHTNKTSELLWRALPHLPPGAAFAVVVPQTLLHRSRDRELREFLASHFEFREICLFPDNVFRFSDMESAIILGRRAGKRAQRLGMLRHSRVREGDVAMFRETYSVPSVRSVAQNRFSAADGWDLRIPELEAVWTWCSSYQKLGQAAHIGQGLFYKGQAALTPGAVTTLHRTDWPGDGRVPKGFAKGFVRFRARGRKLNIHELPDEALMNLDPAAIDRAVTGARTGVAQVLLNYAPVSRGPWRLMALIDRTGHAVTSRFLTVRPKSEEYPLEFLWAVCNSPVANAYAYCHLMKRDNLVGTVRKTPMPHTASDAIRKVTATAAAYLETVASRGASDSEGTADRARQQLAQVDAEVLRLYELPPRYERQLLDLFTGHPRPGVPFEFTRYFPEDFEPCFHWYEYISEGFRRSTAGQLRARHKNVTSPTVLAALRNAVDGFQE